ncbi:MAG: fibronectin type III domain-containing protein, partial [Chitinispirillaceae bacterium]
MRSTIISPIVAVLAGVTIAMAQPPAAPTLSSPANGATNVALNPTLTWDSSAGASHYQLQVAKDSSFNSIVFSDSMLTSTSRAISSLVNSTTYYWRVRASNTGGTSAWSADWRFTTVSGLPGTPTLVSPSNGQTNVSTNPMMTWNSAAGAATYRLQVATDSTFATTIFDDSTLTL